MGRRAGTSEEFAATQQKTLEDLGLSAEEVRRGLEPTLSFHAQLREDVEWYERVRRGYFETIHNLAGLGRLLIALRIAAGLSQKDLADRLGVSEAQVSRDERNEYHGITIERARRILEVLGTTTDLRVVQPPARNKTAQPVP